MGAVAWRRRFPLSVLGFVVAGMLVLDSDGQFSVFAALVIVGFTAGAEVDPPRAWIGLALAVIPFWVGFAVIGGGVSDFVAVTVLYGGSWASGRCCGSAANATPRSPSARNGPSGTGRPRQRGRSPRSARGSPASCTTSSPTRSASSRCRRRPAPPALGAGPRPRGRRPRAIEATARQAMAEMRRLSACCGPSRRAAGTGPAAGPGPARPARGAVAGRRAAGGAVVEGDAAAAAAGRGSVRVPDRPGGADQRAQARRPAAPWSCVLATATRDLDRRGGHRRPAGGHRLRRRRAGHGLVGMRERVSPVRRRARGRARGRAAATPSRAPASRWRAECHDPRSCSPTTRRWSAPASG